MNTTQQNNASRGTASAVAWGLTPVGWFALLYAWLALDGDLPGPVQTALGIVVLALPAPWLLWAAWKMPRPRVRTYLAEAGALAAMLLSLFVTAVYFLLGADPTETAPIGFTAAYLAAAAVLAASARPLPNRRIAYGAPALACAVFAISVQVPQWRTPSYMDGKLAAADEVLLYVLMGAIVLGVILQAAWWLLRRRRA
ncbi:hypothetical protein [Glycomyces sp. NPDC048151]|uniref:hypothetical protein n=1 Tax=Glycomyces sp. NPDC048151 TaxID=3364002 RepID=UPI00371955BF